MRLRKLKAAGFPAFPLEVEVDLDALGDDARVVAITGSNGAGKSTLLELFPAGLFREAPTRGTLAKLATARDSYVELTVENGARYTIRQLVDASSGKGETVILDAAGSPVLDSAKVSHADAWVRSHLPAPEVLYASTFAAQGSGGFIDLSPTERKKVLLRILGIEHLERLAEGARERVREARGRLATAEARLADERGRSLDPEAAEATLAMRRQTAAGADDELSRVRLALADAEAAAADATALLREHERKRLEAADLRRRAAELDAKATAERERIADLGKRITNNEAVLARGDEIRAAVGCDAEIASGLVALAAEVKRHDEDTKAAQARVSQAQRDVDKARGDLGAARQRLAEVNRIADACVRDGVTDAAANLEIARGELSRAEVRLAEVEADLEAARGQRIASSEQRIKGLREGLEEIASAGSAGRPAITLEYAQNTACDALFEDDRAVKAAAEVPALVAKLEAGRTEAATAVRAARERVSRFERLAARMPEFERARAQAGPLTGEIDSAERAVTAAEAVLAAARASASGVAGALAELDSRRQALDVARRNLAATVALAGPLAQAEARLEELRPQLEAARTARDRLRDETLVLRDQATATDPGEAPKEPDLDAARARVAAFERAAREAHAGVAVAEKALEDARAAAGRIAALDAERDGIFGELADWTRLANDLGKNGLQALEVDAAGPQITATANALLHEAFGPRFTISIDTTKGSADGKRELETCEITVLDTVRGREGTAETFSGGERVILSEAVSLALAWLSCQRNGIDRPTVIRDESGAALDSANAAAYVRMLRKAADLIGADRVLLVSHSEAVQEMCDVRLAIEAGRIEVRS